MMNLRYRLSRFIPVPFRSTYRISELQARRLWPDYEPGEGLTAFNMRGAQAAVVPTDGAVQRVRSSWWQHRGRIFRHRITLA